MRLKSDLEAASLRIAGRSCSRDKLDGACCSVKCHNVPVMKPTGESRDSDHGWDSKLTRDYRRVRKEAAALHEYAACGREEHNPTRISSFGHQYLAWLQQCRVRVANHAYRSANGARAAAETLPTRRVIACVVRQALKVNVAAATHECRREWRAARLESVGRRCAIACGGEFRLSHRGKAAQIR